MHISSHTLLEGSTNTTHSFRALASSYKSRKPGIRLLGQPRSYTHTLLQLAHAVACETGRKDL
jgi:hypothetical protein